MSQFMRAHGHLPGPTQRPVLAGVVSGFLAELAAFPVLWTSGALASLCQSLNVPGWALLAGRFGGMVLAGAVYGKLFGRTANDRRGGWLFGISYGFLIWLVGPVTVLQAIMHAPVAVGLAGIGLFGAHLAYGVALGLLFPWVHAMIQRRLGGIMHG